MLRESRPAERALELARKRGIARTRDFQAAGISRTYLGRLCEQGKLIRLGRGLYQAADFERFHAAHDLAETVRLVPNGVICLLSALQAHSLTTQAPHAVWLMIGHKARVPRIPFPHKVVRASGKAFSTGRMKVAIESVEVIVTDPAKTVADCFKYRRHVGIDVAIEALKDCLRQRKATQAQLWRYAGICRVQPIMRPYLEALA
ncbi:MAG TPA: type IV toxin-antitoxin system AbiEi family antitoxin domain-containing protein [Rhizomicrobium sp.]|nr:type IV toxin-antitoxin system AbiEi family antitoxin domain-containing protein [Rhizomicrobium sp.]